MNAWQAARQLVYLLAVRSWPDAPGEVVFASVHATTGPVAEGAALLRFPFALVRPGSARPDEQARALKIQSFEVVVAVAHAGDVLGEHALVGGQRASAGRSPGRGLLEVEEQFHLVLDEISRANGLGIQSIAAGSVEAAHEAPYGYVAARRYSFDALLTTAREYVAPNGGKPLTPSNNAGGSVRLTWTLSPDRFDFHAATPAKGGLVLRRLAGATPPASATVGTGVALGTVFDNTVVDAPGAGQFSYALFAGHDEGVGSTRYSPAATLTVTVAP